MTRDVANTDSGSSNASCDDYKREGGEREGREREGEVMMSPEPLNIGEYV